ncbi:hypothetical protein SV7mr_50400 [Stieleria bergensis]|uniref:PLD phosphodiesterase domain-containing protein n=1 Tax=Stieleria bergensis TaxID=2528025 RepID=A0A517T2A8_9BACT|nr:hypothetical protein SV7mr_50400 [Planctomycetes bacterium SV_7m_r]
MFNDLVLLRDSDLKSLIDGLEARRVTLPTNSLQISRLISTGLVDRVVDAINSQHSLGFKSEHLVATLELIRADRNHRKSREVELELVTSGPEAAGITNRETAVVVREMFAHARESVLVVGYAVFQGQQVFEALANRMESNPDLDVRFFLNIARPDRDRNKSDILVSRFIQRFKSKKWPSGCCLPEIYFDPRSVADDAPVRSSLHAKCVVVDREQVFVSSANFTEAGQQRNIEVGLRIEQHALAEKLTMHFERMRDAGLFQRDC